MALLWIVIMTILSISGIDAKGGQGGLQRMRSTKRSKPTNQVNVAKAISYNRTQLKLPHQNINNSALNIALVELFGEPEPLTIYDPLPSFSMIRKRCVGSLACEFHLVSQELENIVIDKGIVYLHNPDQETQDIVKEYIDGKLPPVKIFINSQIFVTGLSINITNSKPRCQHNFESTYFLVPWLPSNAFHTVNDNIFALLTQVLLQHIVHPKPMLAERTLFMTRGSKSSTMFHMIKAMFNDNVLPASSALALQGGPVCIRRLSWYTPQKVFYRDALENLRRALSLLFKGVLSRVMPKSTHTTSTATISAHSRNASMSTLPFMSGDRKLRAIIVSRNTGPSRVPSSRSLTDASESLLKAQLEKYGVDVELCNFQKIRSREDLWNAFASVDICLGIHGAGLSNCLFMPEGGVMVELQPAYAYAFTGFMKMSFMVRSTYVHVDLRPYVKNKEDITVPGKLIQNIVQTALRAHGRGTGDAPMKERLASFDGDGSFFKKDPSGTAEYLTTQDPLITVFPHPDTSLKMNDILGPLVGHEAEDCVSRIYYKFPFIVNKNKDKNAKPEDCAFRIAPPPINRQKLRSFVDLAL